MTDTHIVLVRPLATDRWKPLAYAKSAEAAIKLAQKPRKCLRRGDLILPIDIAEVSDIQERGKCLYFVNKTGDIKQAPKLLMGSMRYTWFSRWEGPDARADTMLFSCPLIDRKLLVKTVCTLVRECFPYLPARETRHIDLIKELEDWTTGKEITSDVHAIFRGNFDDISAAVMRAFDSVPFPHNNPAYAVENAASAMPGNFTYNLRQLSHIVRRCIPLHIVLESYL